MGQSFSSNPRYIFSQRTRFSVAHLHIGPERLGVLGVSKSWLDSKMVVCQYEPSKIGYMKIPIARLVWSLGIYFFGMSPLCIALHWLAFLRTLSNCLSSLGNFATLICFCTAMDTFWQHNLFCIFRKLKAPGMTLQHKLLCTTLQFEFLFAAHHRSVTPLHRPSFIPHSFTWPELCTPQRCSPYHGGLTCPQGPYHRRFAAWSLCHCTATSTTVKGSFQEEIYTTDGLQWHEHWHWHVVVR